MGDSRGFTIVELTVTIIFLGFVVLGISSLYLSIANIQRQSQYTEIANRAAQTEVESLRNSTYNQLVAGQDIDFTTQLSGLPNATGTVVVTEPESGLKRVDVTVSYNAGSQQHDVTLSSLIGVIGITQ
jgi:type II secretory pathway pseudopilin PulG